MARVHPFEQPDRFAAGWLGEGDERTHCLQVRQGHALATVTLTAENLEALRDTLAQLLTEHGAALLSQLEPTDDAPLDAPVEPAFHVAALAVYDDAVGGAVVVLASDADLFGADGDEPLLSDLLDASLAGDERPGAVVTVRLERPQVLAFVARTSALLADGRPACPLCAQPVDPSGHVCPRRNGYRGRDAWPTRHTRL